VCAELRAAARLGDGRTPCTTTDEPQGDPDSAAVAAQALVIAGLLCMLDRSTPQ